MTTTLDAAEQLMSIEERLGNVDGGQAVTVGDLLEVVRIVRRVFADLPAEISRINELERFIRDIHQGRIPDPIE